MKTYKSYIKEYNLKVEERNTTFEKVKITTVIDAANYIRKHLYSDDLIIYELFFMLLLNRGNNVIGFVKISQGGLSGTVTDVRMICKYAIDTLATAVIIAHNHPSGNEQPSTHDISMTTKIQQALKLFDVTLLDHVIITENNHYSLSDNGIF